MAIDINYLETLSAAEIDMINAYIYELYRNKVNHNTENYENLKDEVRCCPHCGSVRIVKNGFNPKRRQKYRCKECRSVFLPTTGTLFTHSKVTYAIWTQFIACEINGLSLSEEAVATGLTRTTCFSMRHKLYSAVPQLKEHQLSGQIELDPVYAEINLKGTKAQNMPRLRKKRGLSKKSTGELRGISHHKVCIISAIDENDNILLKIAGIGVERKEYLDKYAKYFKPGSECIVDEKRCLETFAMEHGMKADVIPTTAFKSRKGRTLADINQIHQSISDLQRRKHGVSLRHLQGYLDWLVFCKYLRYRIKDTRRKVESYMTVMVKQILFTTRQVCLLHMPVDLSLAYDGEISPKLRFHQLFA